MKCKTGGSHYYSWKQTIRLLLKCKTGDSHYYSLKQTIRLPIKGKGVVITAAGNRL